MQAPTVRMNSHALLAEASRLGIFGDEAIGTRVGVAATTIYRARTGAHEPSSRLIAAVLLAFPELRFADVFEVTMQDVKAA